MAIRTLYQLSAYALSALLLLPVLTLFAAGMESFDGDYWTHFLRTVAGDYLTTTLILVVGVILGCLLIGGGTAWITSHYDFPGRPFLQWALILPLALPADVIGLVYRDLTAYMGPIWSAVHCATGWSVPLPWWFLECESWGGLIFVLSLAFYPFTYLILHTAWRALPRTWSETASATGLSPFRAALRITLPLTLPAILVSCLVSGFLALNDYGTTLLFGKRGLAVAVHNLWHGFDRPVIAAQLAALLALTVFVLLLLAAWFVIRRNYYDPITPKLPRPLERLAHRPGASALAFCSLPLLLGFLLPFVTLAVWAVPRLDRAGLSQTLLYAGNSLLAAIPATLLCLGLALFFVFRDLGKPTSNPRRILLLGLNAGFFIPAIAVSVGVLVILSWSRGALVHPLLSSTVAALVYAMTVRLFCLSFLCLSIGRKKLPARIDDLLLYLRRGISFKVGRVYYPLLKRWILAGALLTFVSALKELNLSLALSPVNFVSLSTRIFFYTTHGAVRESALWCLCLVALALPAVIVVSQSLTALDERV